jgi:hypothetical protein
VHDPAPDNAMRDASILREDADILQDEARLARETARAQVQVMHMLRTQLRTTVRLSRALRAATTHPT